MNLKKRLNINYWLRKIYTSSLYQKLPIKKNKLKKLVFTSIYKSNHWVQKDDNLTKESLSISGHGSNLNTKQYFNLEKNFTKLIDDYKIESILDMPCGDFLWLHEIIKEKNIDYLGIDIVEDLIDSNKTRYKKKNFNFISSDILNFETDKKFDLIVIRDLFIHIKNSDISRIIQNIKKMNFNFIALNSYTNEKNKDVITGQHRKVNLLIEPFNLKKPNYHFKDYENDKYFFMYEKKDFI
tara:strand:- start:45 stop:761 length:717 start_codon:yes stop_codon:yes gene_type:complete